MNGQVAGVPNQITIKNVYGNCTTSGGEPINIVGNTTDFQSDAQKVILEEMALETRTETGEKLYEMFGVNLPASGDLEAEAGKYVRTVYADGVAVGKAISLLKDGAAAGEGFQVAFTVKDGGKYLTGGETLTLAVPNDTAATLVIPVTVKLTARDESGVHYFDVNVILPPAPAAVEELMDEIAASYTDSSDGWTVMDMAALRRPCRTRPPRPPARPGRMPSICLSPRRRGLRPPSATAPASRSSCGPWGSTAGGSIP